MSFVVTDKDWLAEPTEPAPPTVAILTAPVETTKPPAVGKLAKPTVVAVAKSVSDWTTTKSDSTEAPAAAASVAITWSPGVKGVAAFPKKLPAVVTT